MIKSTNGQSTPSLNLQLGEANQVQGRLLRPCSAIPRQTPSLRACSAIPKSKPQGRGIKNVLFIFQKCVQKMILPKPLFLKGSLNSISDVSLFFPYFQLNKETKRSDPRSAVEKRTFSARTRRPVRDGMSGKHCVPNGTPRFACTFVFYQYHIPNGMTKSIRQFSISAFGGFANAAQRRSPVRDNILVEKRTFSVRTRRPVRDGMSGKHCVPNGTPRFACAFVFYQYHIPNGMTKSMRQFSISAFGGFANTAQRRFQSTPSPRRPVTNFTRINMNIDRLNIKTLHLVIYRHLGCFFSCFYPVSLQKIF